MYYIILFIKILANVAVTMIMSHFEKLRNEMSHVENRY